MSYGPYRSNGHIQDKRTSLHFRQLIRKLGIPPSHLEVVTLLELVAGGKCVRNILCTANMLFARFLFYEIHFILFYEMNYTDYFYSNTHINIGCSSEINAYIPTRVFIGVVFNDVIF